MTVAKRKPSLVEKAKGAIVNHGRSNEYFVYSKVKEKLTKDDKISKSTFNKAWRELRDSGRIIPINEGDKDFEDYRKENFKAKTFYKLVKSKEPHIYLDTINAIEKINSLEKAFSFIGRLTPLFNNLDVPSWESLLEKFKLQISKVNFEGDDLLTIHFWLLEHIHFAVDKGYRNLSPGTLKIIQDEIAAFLPKIDDGYCSTSSAIGIVSRAFSLIWKLNREMGKAEFVNLFNKAIESLDDLGTSDNLERVKRYFMLFQCYVHACSNFGEYFSKNEREDLFSRLQNTYFAAPDIKDIDLRARIESVLYWLVGEL
jgi:hypothetical protein